MISDKLNFVIVEYGKLENRIADYTKKIAQLTAAGTTQAKWYIRKDRSNKTGEIVETHYLLHPMRDGKRRKEYVGRDEWNIKLAQDRIDRFEKRDGFIKILNHLKLRQNQIEELVNQLVPGSF